MAANLIEDQCPYCRKKITWLDCFGGLQDRREYIPCEKCRLTHSVLESLKKPPIKIHPNKRKANVI